MKTDELISLLARDTQPVKRGVVPLRLFAMAIGGAVVALVILMPWLGVRADLMEAAAGPTYWMKTLYTLSLGGAGYLLAERLARPGASARDGWVAVGLAITVMVAVSLYQLSVTAPEGMRDALLATTWDKCPWRIVVLALPALIAALVIMRGFAPTRPMLAGAAAGLLAGGVAATIYGLHCQETAAPFVTLFYTLGVALTAGLGAIVGSRLLRW